MVAAPLRVVVGKKSRIIARCGASDFVKDRGWATRRATLRPILGGMAEEKTDDMGVIGTSMLDCIRAKREVVFWRSMA